jgi:hypothetical protein
VYLKALRSVSRTDLQALMFGIIGISSILIFFFGVLLSEAGTCYGAFGALRALCVGELALTYHGLLWNLM